MLKIISIKDFKSFQEIKRDWQFLETKIGHQSITSSYDWVENWWRIFKNRNDNNFGINKQLRIILLINNNEIKAIFPLTKLYRKFAGFRVSFLEFIAQQWGGCSNDLISTDLNNEEIRFLLNWIKKNISYDFILLKYLSLNTILSPYFKMYLYTACPIIKIAKYKHYDEYKSKNYSKNLKRNLIKSNNRAKRKNIIIERSIEDINPKLLREIKKLSLEKTRDGKISLYNDVDKQKCYNNAYRMFESNVTFVRLNNKHVSYATNIIINNKKYGIDISYDRDYKEYDLGTLTVDRSIKDSFERELEIHSLGPGLDSYKSKFTKEIEKLYMIGSGGNTIKSLILNPLFKYFLKKRDREVQEELHKIKL
jgi:hypothetical protein